MRQPHRLLINSTAVAENQPPDAQAQDNKNRMNKPTSLSAFGRTLRELIVDGGASRAATGRVSRRETHHPLTDERSFNELALELFRLQFQFNSSYKRICESLGWTPDKVEHWTQVPCVPTAAFKELELTSLAADERSVVFHSSGTTQQRPSRHFHSAESLTLYEASLWAWFQPHLLYETSEGRAMRAPRFSNAADGSGTRIARPSGPDALGQIHDVSHSQGDAPWASVQMLSLTPPPSAAPHSSLAHMLGVVADKLGAENSAFAGVVTLSGWQVDLARACDWLARVSVGGAPALVLGTAFQFVELTDHCAEHGLKFTLPAGSRVMETGGYKGRTRELPKAELHERIADCLGIAPENIVCEYGMSELSSQAYQFAICDLRFAQSARVFRFPHWARARIISPENGREVGDGQSGLVQVFDLANVWSVAAVRTEDLAVRRGDGFELLGRAKLAEARGCSLMTA